MKLFVIRKYVPFNPFRRGQVVVFEGLSLKAMEAEIHRPSVADWWVE